MVLFRYKRTYDFPTPCVLEKHNLIKKVSYPIKCVTVRSIAPSVSECIG